MSTSRLPEGSSDTNAILVSELNAEQQSELRKRMANFVEKPGFVLVPLCFRNREGFQIVLNYIPQWTRHQCELLGLLGALEVAGK